MTDCMYLCALWQALLLVIPSFSLRSCPVVINSPCLPCDPYRFCSQCESVITPDMTKSPTTDPPPPIGEGAVLSRRLFCIVHSLILLNMRLFKYFLFSRTGPAWAGVEEGLGVGRAWKKAERAGLLIGTGIERWRAGTGCCTNRE